jgi:hypothetical protein
MKKSCLTLFFLAAVGWAGEGRTVTLDFAGKEIPAGWSVANASWKPAEGELRGVGGGSLAWGEALGGDFTLTFRAWTEEKANVEVWLVDPKDDHPVYTFAFLGQYHSVLDGVKSAILKEQAFVNVSSRMWIFPGRMFTFEVRRAKNQMQMFLNGELGPFFVDDSPPENIGDLRLKIMVSTEGAKDKVRLDDVKVEMR